MNNQRRHFRYHFDHPLQAFMSFSKIHEYRTITKKAPIYLRNVSGSGLCFISPLRFPITPVIEYEFLFTLMKHDFHVLGTVVRRNHPSSHEYEYGVQFTEEQKFLIYIIKQLSMKFIGKRNRVI